MLKEKERNLSFGIAIFIVVLFLAIGYSAFGRNLLLDDIALAVRPNEDIRVTGAWEKESNNAEVSSVDYAIRHLFSTVTLSEENSTVTYRLEITNIGNVEMGIYEIIINNENLEVEITSDYKMKDKLCVNNKCNLGMKKEIEVTIKYKPGAFDKDNTTYDVLLFFDFRAYHNVTYTDFAADTSIYPQGVMDRDNFEMTLVQPYPVGAIPFINGEEAEYHYEKDTLIVENVTEDIEIKSNYIQYIEDLVALSNNVNGGNPYNGKNIILTRDLDFANPDNYRNSERVDFENYNKDSITSTLYEELNDKKGYGFVSIGIGSTNNVTNRFNGNFDGQNHTLSNLYVSATNHHAGLFGLVGKSGSTNEIINLTLTGDIIKSSGNSGHVGGIVASTSASNLKIENVHSKVNITNNTTTGAATGIIGYANENLDIINCSNYGEINSGSSGSGLVGYAGSTSGLTKIYNSHNYGSINATSSNVGGLMGESDGKIIVNNSHNEGKIIVSAGSKIGGLIGHAGNASCIMNSYNIGEVDGKNSTYVGGVVGSVYHNTIIVNSYNGGNITGLNVVGLFYSAKSKPTIFLNTIYNYGDLSGSSRYGAFYSSGYSSIVSNNVYYKEGTGSANNITTAGFILKSNADMKSDNFVDMLNNNANNINKNDLKTRLLNAGFIDNNFEINFNEWIIGKDGYPTLNIK